jgi:hypothetical protein
MTYKQPNQVTLDDGKKIKNFYWKVIRWGKDEQSGEAFAEVLHWFVQTEPTTSDLHSRLYTKSMAASPTLLKVENFLVTLPQYVGSESL